MKRFKKWGTVLILLIFFLSGPALSQEKADKGEMNGVEALVELLTKQGVISDKEAAAFRQANHRETPDQGLTVLVNLLKEKKILKAEDADNFVQRYGGKPLQEPGGAVSILADNRNKEAIEELIDLKVAEIQNDLQEHTTVAAQDAVAEGIKKEKETFATAVPEWTKRIRWGGDIRLRYQGDRYDKNNALMLDPSDPTSLMNTTVNQDHFKYRARLEATAKINDKAEATVRLATGNESNPVSTNTALGNNFNKDKFLLDLAYIKLQPWEPVTFYGGRMPNPWFSTDLVWDNDLNFDGVALNVKKTFGDSYAPFFTVGVFPLQEQKYFQTTKYLSAVQAGLEKKSDRGVGFKAGAAYYYFHNITGVRNDASDPHAMDWTAPAFQQKGNTLFNISTTDILTAYAAEFRELNLTGQLYINFWNPYRLTFTADYVKNLGFDIDKVRTLAGPDVPKEDAIGYQLGLTVGYPSAREFGQWNVSLFYKYLQADAVVDAYTDSDFHLGGTNAKGWVLGAEFGLMKNVWLTLRWLTADEIKGEPLAIDVFQADLNAKF